MQTWSDRRPSRIAERFWSLAEVAERGAPVDRSRPVGVVRHILDILSALQGGPGGIDGAASMRALLSELRSREAAGDLSYTAPERLEGLDSGERALVFSIGVLLFEGLTGHHPLDQAPPSARVVPTALRGLLSRSMRPDPEDRYASIAALRAELEWFVVAEEEEGGFALPGDHGAEHATGYLAVPPVVVDDAETELITVLPSMRREDHSGEIELETALVPRLSLEDLQPVRKRAPLAIPVVGIEIHLPRRSQPRKRRPRTLFLVGLTAGLALTSAAFTALALAIAQRW